MRLEEGPKRGGEPLQDEYYKWAHAIAALNTWTPAEGMEWRTCKRLLDMGNIFEDRSDRVKNGVTPFCR